MRRNTSMKPETLHSGLRHRSHPQPNHAGRGRAHALCARAMDYCSRPCKRGGPRGRAGRVAAWACAHPCASFSSKKVDDETPSAPKTEQTDRRPSHAQKKRLNRFSACPSKLDPGRDSQ